MKISDNKIWFPPIRDLSRLQTVKDQQTTLTEYGPKTAAAFILAQVPLVLRPLLKLVAPVVYDDLCSGS